LVDFSQEKISHSDEVKLTLGSTVRAVQGAYELPPGATLKLEYQLPQNMHEAELYINHAPGEKEKPLFITITLGKKTIVGRYMPPRRPDGRLRIEQWPVELPGGDVSLFIYNNQSAGSESSYHIGGIQLIYRHSL